MPIVADNLSFRYRSRGPLVLDSVSLAIKEGVITAIAGPNGAGKSTLLRLLLGLLRPTAGTVHLDGRRLASFSHRARARRIAYVPQRTSLAFAFTVREYIRLGLFAAGAGGTVAGEAGPAHDTESLIAAAMARVDIADRADDPVPVLSAGQQQRATLARALAQLEPPRPEPGARILLADEPVSAMDPRHALMTMDILRQLAAAGHAVVVVLHDLTLVARFCDLAILLDQRGRIAAAGPVAEALTPESLAQVFSTDFLQLTGPDGVPILIATRPAGTAGGGGPAS